MRDDLRPLIEAALGALKVRRLVLAIHDVSFPSAEGQDTGRGTPYAEGGRRFLRFARDLGFTGVQLGPQGETSLVNPSPYDGAIFARDPLSISLWALSVEGPWGRLLAPEDVAEVVSQKPPGCPGRAQHRYLFQAQRRCLTKAFLAFWRAREQGEQRDLLARFENFQRENADWLWRAALYEPLCEAHGHGHFRFWSDALDQCLFAPEPAQKEAASARLTAHLARYRERLERFAFWQLLAHEQHQELRRFTTGLGLSLYGDLQIGLSPRDVWAYQALFLKNYLMGAPPSRTNPLGQPWGYPVLDPAQYKGPPPLGGPALQWMRARVRKMFREYDGVRVDHPHGLVCPWVYRADEPDPLRAVQQGARLFSSPDLPDHPALARYALVSPEQINRDRARHADDWLNALTPEQVEQYSVLVDLLVDCAHEAGRHKEDLLCEVLSTMPRPLEAVLARHGLGRFRVTQKADLKNPRDVYRSENATPPDWIMLGNHDTRPIWLLADLWARSGELLEQAAYLAKRLAPTPQEEESLRRSFGREPHRLVQAKFAEMFLSEAENVMVFFTDLLGIKEVYNTPGTVSDDNWSLRVPDDYERRYREESARGEALNLPYALSLALIARGGEQERALAARLRTFLQGTPLAS